MYFFLLLGLYPYSLLFTEEATEANIHLRTTIKHLILIPDVYFNV